MNKREYEPDCLRTRPTSGIRKTRRAAQYCFSWNGDHHRLSAKQFYQGLRVGYLVRDKQDNKLAYVRDKYKAVFDHSKKEWSFVAKPVIKAPMRTTAAVLMKSAIFVGRANEWRLIAGETIKLPSDHPFVLVYPQN